MEAATSLQNGHDDRIDGSGSSSLRKPQKPANGSFNIIKALFILGLPFVHIVESFEYYGVVDDGFFTVAACVALLSVFGPTVFMICMGIGLAKSNSPKRMRKLGIQMLIINTALNLIRCTGAGIISASAGLVSVEDFVLGLFGSDIYVFVGLFLIAYSFLKELKLSTLWITIIALIGLVADIFISLYASCDIPIIDVLISNFISCGVYPFFPLLGWFIYPCIGIIIEERLLCKDARMRTRCMILIFVAGLLLVAAGCAITSVTGSTLYEVLFNQVAYNAYGFSQVALLVGIAFIMIALFYFIYHALPINRVEEFLLTLSTLLFPFYLVQWVITALLCVYPCSIASALGSVLILGPVLFAILAAIDLGLSLFITLKWGFSISRWLFKASNYSRWFKPKKRKAVKQAR